MRVDLRYSTPLLIVGLVMVGFGLASIRPTGPGLVVDASSKSFGEVTVGEVASVQFTLTNRTAFPIRVVGASETCRQGGCSKGIGLPVVVPPYGKAEVGIAVKTQSAAAYRTVLTFFTEDSRQFRLLLEMTGAIRPRPSGKSG